MGYSVTEQKTSFINPATGRNVLNRRLLKQVKAADVTAREASQVGFLNMPIDKAFRLFITCEVGDNGTFCFKNGLGDFVKYD